MSHDPDAPLAASIRSAIAPFIVMDVMEKAARAEHSGQDVIHCEVGQPGHGAPEPVLRAAEAALRSGPLGYTEALGLPALRARIAAHYDEHYGVRVAPSRVVITTGSSAGFVLAFLALFDAGARVGLPEPGYPCYRNIISALGLEPVAIPLSAAHRWMPTPDDLAAAGPLDGLILASPANPTGTMLSAERLASLVRHCRRHGVAFISDEIYHRLEFGTPAATALSVDPECIVINSFSKYYAMTGWRIGWMVVPEALVRPIEKLAQNFFISAPTLSQIAAIAAFDATDELEGHRANYARNREELIAAVARSGLGEPLPADGAFYLYVALADDQPDAANMTARLLAELGIAATPGQDFDPRRGKRFVRFSYAGAPDRIAEAARRLSQWRR